MMKVSAIWLCLMTLCMQLLLAKEARSQKIEETQVKLGLKNESLKTAFRKIEEQTLFRFAYRDKQVAAYKRLNIPEKTRSLQNTLRLLLVNTGLEFTESDGNIIIFPEKEAGPVWTGGSSTGDEPGLPVKDRYGVVHGKVTDKDGKPLAGVSVLIKGTGKGTTTNDQGQFEIRSADENTVLVFTSLGYESQELPANGQTDLSVVLKEKAESGKLNEVVVVGYGTQKRSDVIGSVSQIPASALNDRQVPELSNALTGQVPGVTVIQNSGRPGNSNSTIQIRGIGSFGAGTTPLILVDGIPTNSFDNVDPNDVESISVLKDASSSAIYGARAANGVILVTTKLGTKDKAKVSYNGYIGFQKATALPDQVPSWEYAQLYNEASGTTTYSAADIQNYKNGTDRDHYPNNNFIDSVLTRKGAQTGHNISVSGKSSLGQVNLSVGYLNQEGIVIRNNYDRYNLRLNLTSNISKKLTVTTRLSAVSGTIYEPEPPATADVSDMQGIIMAALRFPAIVPATLSNGQYGTGLFNSGTPISYLASSSFLKTKNTDLNANMKLDWDVIPGLRLSAIGAYDLLENNSTNFLATQVLNGGRTLGPNNLTAGTGSTDYRTFQALADYNKQLGKHHLGVLAGYSFEDNYTQSLSAYRNNIPSNNLTQINAGDASSQTNSGTASEWAIQSVFGRLKYDYDKKYLLEGTLRYDGSSRFPPNLKYALFPSVAAGWQIGDEHFIRDHFNWVDQLKLKASYGVLGNQNIANYPYQNTFATGINYSFGGVLTPGAAVTQQTDPNLHWESTRSADLGVELSVFKQLLSVSATYFDRHTYDILYSPSSSVSSILGYTLSQENTGRLENKGWEFTVDHHNRIGKFSYSVGFNATIINNKVLDLGVGDIKQPNGSVGNGSSLFIGKPMNIIYGYTADGLYTNAADVSKGPNVTALNPSPQPGDIKYKDISGPGGVPDGTVNAAYDQKVLGSTLPRYTYGITLGGKYKGFDLNILLQGVADVSGMLSSYASFAFLGSGTIQQWQADGRWTTASPRADAAYPRLQVLGGPGAPNTINSSFWVLNASYLKLRNVQLGYSIDKTLLRKAGIDGIRFYVSAENLHTWSHYRQGWDPEINTGGSYYPILASYSLGLNVNF